MESAVPSEMEIVDTFTHLIFWGDGELSPEESAILRTLLQVDQNAARISADAAPGDVGAYLRALGVREMIQLVARVQAHYLRHSQSPQQPLAAARSPAAQHPLFQP